MPEVVRADLAFEPIDGVAERAAHDPGVVHQHVNAVDIEVGGEPPDRRQVGQVEPADPDIAGELAGDTFALADVAAGEDDIVAARREGGNRAGTHTCAGAGDDHCAVDDVETLP